MVTTELLTSTTDAEKSVLIVEDDIDFAESIKETLELHGYSVAIVNSGSDAIAQIRKHDPQLALIDLKLGNENGVDLIGRFKQIKPDLVCVIITAFQSVETTISALRKGAYDYISKPFHPEELLSTLDRCFEKINLEASHANMVNELRRHKNQLEELVYSRTLELERSNKELEAFCYSVSHDLRAPLRAIEGFSSILKEELQAIIDADNSKLLARIQYNIQHMGQLIDGLLQLSQISRKDLQITKFNISNLVKEISNSLRTTEPSENLDLVIKPDVTADGDATLISIAISNLIGNALKFTRNTDKPRIEFGDQTVEKNQVYYFKDNGAGFDMRYAGKLFTAFSRLHNKEDFEGTGIGLATVQRIIHKHGGRIWAESNPKEGATFYFTLH